MTDFSYAHICASLRAFNRASLQSYLHTCNDLLRHKSHLKKIKSHTFIGLCSSHFIKAGSNRISRVQSDKTRRKLVLTYFACLQRCMTLSWGHTNVQIYVVFCSDNNTSAAETVSDFSKIQLSLRTMMSRWKRQKWRAFVIISICSLELVAAGKCWMICLRMRRRNHCSNS